MRCARCNGLMIVSSIRDLHHQAPVGFFYAWRDWRREKQDSVDP
jgi:hypothetical protein